MSDSHRPCARCNAPVPPNAPEGLCPRCLLLRVADPTDPAVPNPEPAPPPPPLETVAAAFPHLEILKWIGQGGMGVVYQARQKSLDRLVALKLLTPHRAHDASFAARFAQEARALAALSHPHIVTIHDFGQTDGFYFLLMEYVDGVNLRQLLQSRRLSPEEALAIVPSLCDALQFAHDHGIVHRDIKPENLLLDQAGRVKIADFGIARMLGDEPASQPSVTEGTQAAGTPGYMAPEQKANPRTADSRADIYSLGVVFYEMLTGELPADRLQPPSRKVQIDVRLDAIVLRALEQAPERRYQTASELRTQIETVVTDAASLAPSAGSTPTSSSTPLATLKAASCIAITPERLATFAGQCLLHHNSHQVVLDAEALTISKGPETTRIPLEQIQNVSLGNFPSRHRFLRHFPNRRCALVHLTYLTDGQTRRLCLIAAGRRLFSPSAQVFAVEEWCPAIRDAVEQRTGCEPNSTPAESLGIPPTSPGVLALYALGFLVAVAHLLFLVSLTARGGIPQALALAAMLIGVLGAFLVGKFVLGRLLCRRPSAARLLAGALIGLAGLGLGGFRLARLNAQHARTEVRLAQEVSAPNEQAAGLASQEFQARSALARFEVNPSDAASEADPAARTNEYRRLTQTVQTARASVDQLNDRMADEKALRATLGAASPSRSFRAWLPLVPLFFACLAIVLRRRDGPSDPSTSHPSRGRFGDATWVASTVAITFLIAAFVDRVYSRQPEVFESYFTPPTRPFLTHLGWSPVAVSNHVVLVDLETELARYSAEVRLEFTGPHLPDDVDSAFTDPLQTKPQGILLRPHPFSGNAPRTLLPPGRHTTRVAFAFPDARFAEQAFRSIAARETRAVAPNEDLGATLFHIFRPLGQEYRARFRVCKVLHSGHPDWVSFSRFGSWNENGLSFTWTLQTTRPGTLKLALGEDRSSAWISQRQGDLNLIECQIRLQLTPIGTNRVRLVQFIDNSQGSIEQPGNYRDLAAEILRTASSGTRCIRGESTELCRFEGKALVAQMEDMAPPSPHAVGPAQAQVRGRRPSVLLLLVVVVMVLGGLSLLAFLLLRRANHKRPGSVALPILAILGILVLALLVLLGGATLLFIARSESPTLPKVQTVHRAVPAPSHKFHV